MSRALYIFCPIRADVSFWYVVFYFPPSSNDATLLGSWIESTEVLACGSRVETMSTFNMCYFALFLVLSLSVIIFLRYNTRRNDLARNSMGRAHSSARGRVEGGRGKGERGQKSILIRYHITFITSQKGII